MCGFAWTLIATLAIALCTWRYVFGKWPLRIEW